MPFHLDRCKSYPFIREELEEYDPTGYRLMEGVWGEAERQECPG